jgi:hypothetical protein
MLHRIHDWRLNPCKYGEEVFGFYPTDKQADIMMDYARPGAKVAVKSGHGVGKSGVEAILALWGMSLFPDSKVPCTAPSKDQLYDVLMAEIGKWLGQAHPWFEDQINYSSMHVSVKGAEKTQFITARTARAEKPDALQGLHATHMFFIVDEAFGVSDAIFQVARGALSTENARVLMCGNPTATSGYVYNAFHRNKRLWSTHTLSCLESPLVSKQYIDEMKEEFGEESDIYKVRVLGQFPDSAICQLIPTSVVEAALGKHLQAQAYSFAPSVLGVDVAWEGDDRSAVFLRQGLCSTLLGSWYNIDTMTLAGLVAQFEDKHRTGATFVDCVGVGAGVVDRLRQMGRDPVAVNAGSSPLEAKYYNKRSEIWWLMKEWLESGGAIPDNDDLRTDLVGPQYAFSPKGKIVLERKRDMKKRGLASPDLGDALALTFALPVYQPTPLEQEKAKHQPANMCETEYELFD